MKTQTYLRFSLLLPYLMWVFAAGIVFLMNKLNGNFSENPIISLLESAVFLYAFGIVLWGIPYTVLAIGLWLWSRGKDTKNSIRVFALSPLILALLIALETFLLTYGDAFFSSGSTTTSIDKWASLAALGSFSVVYGYLIIGITTGIYGILKKSNFIVDESIALVQSATTDS